MPQYRHDQAIDYDATSTGTIVSVSSDATHVTYYIDNPPGGTYEFQYSVDGETWYTHTTHNSLTGDAQNDYTIAARHVRIQLTTAATSGTVNVVLAVAS